MQFWYWRSVSIDINFIVLIWETEKHRIANRRKAKLEKMEKIELTQIVLSVNSRLLHSVNVCIRPSRKSIQNQFGSRCISCFFLCTAKKHLFLVGRQQKFLMPIECNTTTTTGNDNEMLKVDAQPMMIIWHRKLCQKCTIFERNQTTTTNETATHNFNSEHIFQLKSNARERATKCGTIN